MKKRNYSIREVDNGWVVSRDVYHGFGDEEDFPVSKTLIAPDLKTALGLVSQMADEDGEREKINSAMRAMP